MYKSLAFRTSMLEINILKNIFGKEKKKAVNDAILCLNSNLKQKRTLIVCILIDQPHTACQ